VAASTLIIVCILAAYSLPRSKIGEEKSEVVSLMPYSFAGIDAPSWSRCKLYYPAPSLTVPVVIVLVILHFYSRNRP
jgi:hypothetical protein